MSSQQNEAKAGADQPAVLPGAAGQTSAAGQSSPPTPTMPAAGGAGPAGPSFAGQVTGLPAPGRVAFGGPLPGTSNPWKETAGRTVFRRVGPIVLWWIWVAFVLFNLIQIVATEHNYFSVELTAGLLTATGVAYATTLRPRVLATSDGLEVQNPVRDHTIRWGALNGVYLGDAVELSCARPVPRKEKTVYCWALYSGRRGRQKSQQLGVRSWSRMSPRTAPRNEPPVRDPAQLMAAELGRRSTQAKEAGAVAATLESRWAWLPIAFICIPAAALLALLLAR
ncbi:MAG TPA: PH domain-containing protein [Streptosporangiaceae bacterium]|nr:PH domain-containing protein [Streptosporangiaceae bacterium]